MTFKDLTKTELNELVENYIEIRSLLPGLISFEEFLDGMVRRCESCGTLCIMEDFDDELPIVDNQHMCDECIKDSEFHYMHPEEDMMTRWDECD